MLWMSAVRLPGYFSGYILALPINSQKGTGLTFKATLANPVSVCIVNLTSIISLPKPWTPKNYLLLLGNMPHAFSTLWLLLQPPSSLQAQTLPICHSPAPTALIMKLSQSPLAGVTISSSPEFPQAFTGVFMFVLCHVATRLWASGKQSMSHSSLCSQSPQWCPTQFAERIKMNSQGYF